MTYPRPPIDMNRRTALYRLFDRDGQLLYIGITFDPEQRWKSHAAEKVWWSEVAAKSNEWHKTRYLAAEAEVAAIVAEAPKYNVVDNAPEIAAKVPSQRGKRPDRSLRIPDADWDLYAEACADKGISRTDDLRMHIKREITAYRRSKREQS